MKQKSGGIKRLMEFTGKHRGLLTASRILSGISSVFILGPFLCVYFAARDLVGVFAGTPLDTNSLVRWGLLALGLELIGLGLYFSALLCSHVVAFHTEKTLKMAALKHLAKMPMGYFDANPSGKLRKIIDDNSFQTETFIAHQLPDLVGAQVTMIVSLVLMLVFDWRVGIPLLLLCRCCGLLLVQLLEQLGDGLACLLAAAGGAHTDATGSRAAQLARASAAEAEKVLFSHVVHLLSVVLEHLEECVVDDVERK